MEQKKENKETKERYFRTGRKTLTEAQLNKFLSVITDINHLALFKLAVSTGLRRGDIVKVRVNGFDYDNKSITFYEEKKKRIKTVFIPESVANTIQMVLNANPREIYIFHGSSEKCHNKGHISSKTAYNIFQRYLKKSGLEQRPFHSLRATCIKLCQKRGWKPEETAELVGDTLRVIQEHYTIPSDDDMKEVSKNKAII